MRNNVHYRAASLRGPLELRLRARIDRLTDELEKLACEAEQLRERNTRLETLFIRVCAERSNGGQS